MNTCPHCGAQGRQDHARGCERLAPTITVESSHGTMLVRDDGTVATSVEQYAFVTCFDLAEWRRTYGEDPVSIDILDVGYWYAIGFGAIGYEPPAAEWRARSPRAGGVS